MPSKKSTPATPRHKFFKTVMSPGSSDRHKFATLTFKGRCSTTTKNGEVATVTLARGRQEDLVFTRFNFNSAVGDTTNVSQAKLSETKDGKVQISLYTRGAPNQAKMTARADNFVENLWSAAGVLASSESMEKQRPESLQPLPARGRPYIPHGERVY